MILAVVESCRSLNYDCACVVLEVQSSVLDREELGSGGPFAGILLSSYSSHEDGAPMPLASCTDSVDLSLELEVGSSIHWDVFHLFLN